MKTKLNILRANIGSQIILQNAFTFVGLKPSLADGVYYEFRIFHAGRMVGKGSIEGRSVRFDAGEQMPEGVEQMVEAMIREELAELFYRDDEDDTDPFEEPFQGSGRLSLAEIESTSMWRTTK